MPQGPGTYGSNVGRPAKTKKAGSALSGLFGKASRKFGAQMTDREMKALVIKKLRKKFGSRVTDADVSNAMKAMRAAAAKKRRNQARKGAGNLASPDASATLGSRSVPKTPRRGGGGGW